MKGGRLLIGVRSLLRPISPSELVKTATRLPICRKKLTRAWVRMPTVRSWESNSELRKPDATR